MIYLMSFLSFKEDESLGELEFFIISSVIFELLLISLIEIGFRVDILSSSGVFTFHFEISGIDNNESHPLNILFILILLLNFHF